jgi:hypothetical protein
LHNSKESVRFEATKVLLRRIVYPITDNERTEESVLKDKK